MINNCNVQLQHQSNLKYQTNLLNQITNREEKYCEEIYQLTVSINTEILMKVDVN